MRELIWIDGVISDLADASISVEDRGYQFADGVYEVARVYDSVPFTLREHLERMERSARDGIKLTIPYSVPHLSREVRSLIEQSGLRDGMVYIQVTRGVAPRNHVYSPDTRPVVLFYVRELPPVPAPGTAPGVKLVTVDDERWKKCWIKALALLPNVLAKNHAVQSGADEAVFVENNAVSECSVSNLLAVINGTLVTHPRGNKILPGITRGLLLELAAELNIPVQERPLTPAECEAADELMITSTTREVGWVSTWNGKQLWPSCGPTTLRLHRAYQSRVARDTHTPHPTPALATH